MSAFFLELGLTNAVLAFFMSLITFLILRWKKHAQLAALLWLVVLAKFVTPPLIPYSIVVTPEPTPEIQTDHTEFPEPRLLSEPTNPGEQLTQIDNSPSAGFSESTLWEPLPNRENESPFSENPDETFTQNSLPLETSDLPLPPMETAEQIEPESLQSATPWYVSLINQIRRYCTTYNLCLLWAVGTITSLCWWLLSGVRFHRILHKAGFSEPADELESLLKNLCDRMDLKQTPRMRVVNAQISPLIWTWWGRTTILLPKELISTLTLEQQTMVLAHELAHIKRFDHYFRWLEMLVQSLYWWFPPVRWVRYQLHTAQEECCDAWVDRLFPEQKVEYGETLLTTAIWLTNSLRAPVWASEFGRNPGLKKRIEVLLEHGFANPLSKPVMLSCLLIGMILSTCSVRWLTAEEQPDPPQAQEAPQQQEETPNQKTSSPTPPPETLLTLTNQSDQPITTGQVKLQGFWSDGTRINLPAHPIEQGKATLRWNNKTIDTLLLTIEAPGYIPLQKKFYKQPGQQITKLEKQYSIKLEPGIEIGGRVLNESGDPLTDVIIKASTESSPLAENEFLIFDQTTTTDADGNWSLSSAPPKLDKLEIKYEKSGYLSNSLSEELHSQFTESVKQKTHELKMQKFPELTGTILDEKGKPVKDAVILFYNSNNLYLDPLTNKAPLTDQSGRFKLNRLFPGTYQLIVYSQYSGHRSLSVTLPETSQLDLRLKSLNQIKFQVVDLQGKPLDGVSITSGFSPFFLEDLTSMSTRSSRDFMSSYARLTFTTDSYGTSIWKQAPAGEQPYAFSRPGFINHHVTLKPQSEPHKIVMQRLLYQTGNVLAADIEKPITKFSVQLMYKQDDHWQIFDNYRTPYIVGLDYPLNNKSQFEIKNIKGDFSIPVPPRHTEFRFRVTADGFFPLMSDILKYKKDQESAEPLSLEMRSDKNFQALIQTPDGKPASGSSLLLLPYDEIGRYSSYSIKEGKLFQTVSSYRDDVAVEGPIAEENGILKFIPGQHDFCTRHFISHPSGYALLDEDAFYQTPVIKLTPWSTVEGQLLFNGKPAPDYQFQINHDKNFQSLTHKGTTDKQGKFKLENCLSGQHRVSFSQQPTKNRHLSSTFFSKFNVPEGENLSLQLDEKVVDITGKLAVEDIKRYHFGPENLLYISQLSNEENPTEITWQYALLNPDLSFTGKNLKPVDSTLQLRISPQSEELSSLPLLFEPAKMKSRTTDNTINLGEILVNSQSCWRKKEAAKKAKKSD